MHLDDYISWNWEILWKCSFYHQWCILALVPIWKENEWVVEYGPDLASDSDYLPRPTVAPLLTIPPTHSTRQHSTYPKIHQQFYSWCSFFKTAFDKPKLIVVLLSSLRVCAAECLGMVSPRAPAHTLDTPGPACYSCTLLGSLAGMQPHNSPSFPHLLHSARLRSKTLITTLTQCEE